MTGKRNYLSPADESALQTILKSSVSTEEYLDADKLATRAFKQKKSRVSTAITILQVLDHPALATRLGAEVNPPSRAWVNVITEKLESKILRPQNVQMERWIFNNQDVINISISTVIFCRVSTQV